MNPMPMMKLMVWEWIVDRTRRWRSAGCSTRWAILALGLASGLPATAQEPDAFAQTNDAMAAEVLARLNDLVQAADPAQPEDMAPPDDPTSPNARPQAGAPAASGDRASKANRFDSSSRPEGGSRFQGSSRSQKDDRRSRGRRSSGSSGSANNYSRGGDRSQTNSLGGTNDGPNTLDYASFKVIVDRNIFDPNRFPSRGPVVVRQGPPRSFDSLTLVGTMTYEKGTFAFFDGTSSQYKKALKLTDAIAGYKVTRIAPNSVKLASGTNELELSVGAQLRREEDGPWLLAGQSRSYAAAPASPATTTTATTGSDAAASGADSDVLKRLMQKREKE
jgi:hypothetical protein